MAGIYIHIPFCKKACHYCNFHFSTSLGLQADLVAALNKEIEIQKDYLDNAPIGSIYFGGGTPSLLSKNELSDILAQIHKYHSLAEDIEITLEANPDDLTLTKLKALKSAGINRLSIGVQSFFDIDLQWMNRSHDQDQAYNSILQAREAGFRNFSADLIFGSPTTTNEMWSANLEKAAQLAIPHLSCYSLTVEPNTALTKMIELGKTEAPKEDLAHGQFHMTKQFLIRQGYDQYEISNYALPGSRAIHNSNYWNGIPYLGLGPSAHSFNGESRQWNIAHNKKYIDAITKDELPSEIEILEKKERLNEYLMTSLRTEAGCKIRELKNSYPEYSSIVIDAFNQKVKEGKCLESEGSFKIKKDYLFIADSIISELFIVDEE